MTPAADSQSDWLATLCSYFEDAEEATADARAKSELCRDYYDNKQLSAAEKAALEARKQPAVTFNMIRPKVDYMQGLEKQARQDPKAYPRTPNEEGGAEAATDAIRYVCDDQEFPAVASSVWENLLIEGAGGVDVCAEPGPDGEVRVVLKRMAWDRMFWDPHSARPDFSDAKYLGGVTWLDEDDILARWPDADEAIQVSYATGAGQGDTYDDRPKYTVWGDGKRKRVRVAQIYVRTRDGWMFATYTKGGFLDEFQPSPYLDDDDQPECSLIFQSAYVDRDNNRYGMVKDLIDPQDEINKRHQKALHLLSVRQVIAEQGAVRDVDAARREIAKPDGYLEVAPGMRFDIQPTADLATGQAQLLQEAKAFMATMGPNATMQGKQQGTASGRAIALSQQGGVIEAGTLLDAHRSWKKRVYRAIWNRIRQFWTAEKWIRVTDDERNLRFVGLNQPITLGMELDNMPPEQAEQIAAQMGIMPGDPRLQTVLRVENDVKELTVDIVVDEMPDVVTLQQEQFQTLADLAKAGVPLPPQEIIRASSLRNKDQILERMEAAQKAQAQAQSGGPDPRMAEVERKAQRDQAEIGLEAERVGIERNRATADILSQAVRASQPMQVPVPA
jgi:hypothetical protein